MARIRTIKPEAFQSETLAEVSIAAERTLFGLSTQADDRGRHPDKPAVINGAVWPLRPEHTPVDVESELAELERVGLLCRYVGCDGRRYLHLVSWDRHQKIERPSKPRIPRCPNHPVSVTGLVEKCGRHDGDCPITEGSVNPHRTLTEPSVSPHRTDDPPTETSRSGPPSPNPHRTLAEPSVSPHPLDLGPRTLDRGPRTVPPPADAPQVDDESAETTAQTIIGEYVDRCKKRPPGQVISQVGKSVKAMLAEGIDPDDIRRGLSVWMNKGLNPSVLPSVVNEVMNSQPDQLRASRPQLPNAPAAIPRAAQCPDHRGQPADRCGLCRADRITRKPVSA
ncbi:hypothetical protein ACFP2T_13585 [Plantactinospora solaniradicis]|uniref:Uncharacterized protein n=1 Tax=Plantactinospora solaniradicis TaxID=1723736 RepID=A0ABW1K6U8_9ACTN